MDIIRLYIDHNVDYKTEGHKHTHAGWVHTPCPFCTGNPGYHLGYNIENEYYTCWRCGWHPVKKTLSALLKEPEYKVRDILKNYGGISLSGYVKKPKIRIHTFKYPSGITSLQSNHKSYLKKRGYNPEQIESDWMVQGTGPHAKLGNLNFKHRIFIPIYWEGQVVSYLARDITDKSERKYLVCPEDREILNIKKTLYTYPDKDKGLDWCIIVEGVTDVWKLGYYGVGVYGAKVTPIQIRLLSKAYKGGVILFDGDITGQHAARKLLSELKFRGGDWHNHKLEEGQDPGSLSIPDAQNLVKYLKSKYYK